MTGVDAAAAGQIGQLADAQALVLGSVAAAGDRYLVHVGELLCRHVRALDVAGRLGGDEFLVILPMTAAKEARIFASRFQAGLEHFNTAHPEFGQSTVSIGLAEAPHDGTSVAALLAAADAALYKAKGGGRNLIQIAGSP